MSYSNEGIPQLPQLSPLPQVVYEDRSILGIEKPAGLHSVQSGDSPDNSVASWLNVFRPEQKEVSPDLREGGLVQRLDFFTSGIILAAKTRTVWGALRETFRLHNVERTYLALVEGELKEPATVATYLGSPNRGAKKIRVYVSAPDKRARALPAETLFEPVVHRPILHGAEQPISVVRATPRTGRRHQIRAHAAHLGLPLVGDSLYGATRVLSEVLNSGDNALGALTYPGAFLLHAVRLSLIHPTMSTDLTLEARVPDYLDVILKSAREIGV